MFQRYCSVKCITSTCRRGGKGVRFYKLSLYHISSMLEPTVAMSGE